MSAPATENNEKTGFRRGAKTLSVGTSSAEGKSMRGEVVGSKVLALTNFYIPSRTRCMNSSFPFSSHEVTPLQTPVTETTLKNPFTPSPASVYYKPPPTAGGLRSVSCPLDPTRCAHSLQRTTENGLYRYRKRVSKPGRRIVNTGHPGAEVVCHSRWV